jgi:tRNA nucleotidyltransferase (CCA-adding enzyme)
MRIPPLLKTKKFKKWLGPIQSISKTAFYLKRHPYLVGGIVRDLLLRRSNDQDCDVTVTGGSITPLVHKLCKQWHASFVSYPQFMTTTLHLPDGSHLDLISARQERYAYSGALPEVSSGTIQTDLYRRDFTINAMAISLQKEHFGELVDFYEGKRDLQKKNIRILHPKSFLDDPTRIFRAARFVSRFGFHLEKGTQKCLQQALDKKVLKNISKDRIRTELEKIFLEKNSTTILKKLEDWKVLSQIHSNLKWNDVIKARMALFDAFKTGQKNIPCLGFCFWLLEFSPKECADILDVLHLPKQTHERILGVNQLYPIFKKRIDPCTIPRSPLDPETIFIFSLLSKKKGYAFVQRGWKIYQKWLGSKALVNGDDLKKLGYTPGPKFKMILNRIALEKFHGHLKNKQDELAYIVDNFRAE